MTDTVGDALPREMARVRDVVIPQYLSLRGLPGVNVEFGLMNLRCALDRAAKVMAEGDTVGMIRSLQELRGCE